MASFKASLSLLLMFMVVCYALDLSEIDSADLRGESNVRTLFESWRAQNGRLYTAIGEKEKRFEIFKDNLKYITEQNSQGHPYELGLTKFADLTNEEYIEKYGRGLDPAGPLRKNISNHLPLKAGVAAPYYVDWREQGAVTMVIDQGECGSCWAWATVGAIEGIYRIVNGPLVRLSAQELLDCVPQSLGCGGGWPDRALDWIIRNGGIDTADDYPYQWYQQQCNDDKRLNNRVLTIDSYGRLPSNDEQTMMQGVALQPVIACVDIHSRNWQLYRGGIFTADCGTQINHALIIIGYGTVSGYDYWLVKNTWGTNWGENGFMRILRNTYDRTGKCGIAMLVYFPTINRRQIQEGVKESLNISSY